MRRLDLKSFPQFFAEGLAFCFRLCRIRRFPLDGALAERPGPRRKKAGLPKNLQIFFRGGLTPNLRRVECVFRRRCDGLPSESKEGVLGQLRLPTNVGFRPHSKRVLRREARVEL